MTNFGTAINLRFSIFSFFYKKFFPGNRTHFFRFEKNAFSPKNLISVDALIAETDVDAEKSVLDSANGLLRVEFKVLLRQARSKNSSLDNWFSTNKYQF